MIPISIIIPVYNAEEYIDDCLNSILEQTINNYEIIIVNDGSTDKSLERLKFYKEKYKEKIKLYTQDNKGQSSARNYGVLQAEGEYIVYIDADDIVKNDYLERLYSTAQKNKSELVICGYEKIDDNGNILLKRNAKDWEVDFEKGKKHVFQYSPCAKLIKKELLIKNNVKFIEGEKMEDCPYGIITNSIAKNVIVLDYIGYDYRMHEDSTMGQIREKGISISNAKQQFPLNGIEYSINKVREVCGLENDDVLEFCVLKAIAGFVFVFCNGKDKRTQREVCSYASRIIKEYFPNARKNVFIKKGVLGLPRIHCLAVKLLVLTNSFGLLYPFARIYKLISGSKISI